MNTSIYQNGKYLEKNPTWHQEDSPWKAEQIIKMMRKNNFSPRFICEVGCGLGEVLRQLSLNLPGNTVFQGYEISEQAFNVAKKKETERLHYYLKDIFAEAEQNFELLLAIDVLEHVEDYMGFIRAYGKRAEYKIYHIPLDIHVSSVLRSSLNKARYAVGHLHYFSAETALATLKDCGQEILDYCYTDGALALAKLNPSLKRFIANIARLLLSKVSLPFAARVLGGYSLLVLTK